MNDNDDVYYTYKVDKFNNNNPHILKTTNILVGLQYQKHIKVSSIYIGQIKDVMFANITETMITVSSANPNKSYYVTVIREGY